MSKVMFQELRQRLDAVPMIEMQGRIEQVVGLVAEATGPTSRVGDVCCIDPESGGEAIRAEVVGFRNERILLMPFGEMLGIRAGARVRSASRGLEAPAGPELFGRVLDGLGRPIDGLGALQASSTCSVWAAPPTPLSRTMIQSPFETGVRAIDGMLTIGVGQRMGIFAGSGVGKSTLLGMIARSGGADVNVIALVGERGREVREFIENDLGPEGLARSIVVCATSDEPALLRIKAALTATAIAEHFRDRGANVMLMMDSVTRFAMAQREIGLAVGEPPSTKGYTPSVFALLPRLMERAGCGPKGAITAIYTVLVDGDDTNEPIADATRAILDGHIVLSRKLTSRGHYPPIDVMNSLSRVMPMVVADEHLRAANDLREMIASYHDVEDLVSIGAYKEGTRPQSDRAIERWDAVCAYLRQDRSERTGFEQSVLGLKEIVAS